MNYSYSIRKKAMKFISKQERKQQERLLKSIYSLPFGDVKKMSGEENLYRLRVGNFRLLFKLFPKSNEFTLIDVTDADNRGQIYK
ncbi:MAG: type II toxin-antitoxin system RelE/ParE family toxin [Ruminococcus sp.]|nr:type II toxin-antitoxin system RelE/ParE family toxin [Ruminococcus sp.]